MSKQEKSALERTKSKFSSVNFHLWNYCNFRCKYCFETLHDVEGHLNREDALRLIRILRDAGCEKITFSGGEPTLCPYIGDIVSEAHKLGLSTCLITNGTLLGALLDTHRTKIDWIGLSIDSACEAIQKELGRGTGAYIQHTIEYANRVHKLGIWLKINTVVTSLTYKENLSSLIRRLKPKRWKIFQALHIIGQNDGVEPLLVTKEQFQMFCNRHLPLRDEGFTVVTEDNETMRGSYVMIDPLGRFFDDVKGVHSYSEPILKIGIDRAFAQVHPDIPNRLKKRGWYL